MLKITIAGRLGKNAEHRKLQNGTDVCSFSVATDVGWGDNKHTVWVDVAKFGKGAEGLTRYLTKGTSVTVVGDLSTREHEGKTYLNCRADDIALQGGGSKPDNGGSGGASMSGGGGSGDGFGYGTDDPDIPF